MARNYEVIARWKDVDEDGKTVWCYRFKFRCLPHQRHCVLVSRNPELALRGHKMQAPPSPAEDLLRPGWR